MRPDLPAVAKAFIWKPGGPDDPVPYTVIYDALRELRAGYQLRAVAIDGKYLDEMFETLTNEGFPMELFPQSNERMCPAAAGLRTAIIERAFVFDGDPRFAAHLAAPVVKDVGESMFKLTKPRASAPDIDAAEALSMAWVLAQLPLPQVSMEMW